MPLPKVFHKLVYFYRVLIFFEYIKNYFKEGFNYKAHIGIAIFLAACLTFNYTYSFADQSNFYDSFIHVSYRTWPSIAYLILFYCFAFYGAIAILKLSNKHSKINLKYILFGTIGLILLSVDCSYYLMQFAKYILPENIFISYWMHHCISNLSSFITVIIPIYILYFLTKTFRPELFGFALNGAKTRPYFYLILCMIPLVYLASLSSNFLETYPTYTDRYEYAALGWSQWQTVAIYELCYGFDFISVELFFRGFLIVGLSKLIGKEAILPMITVYCFLHFGKPMGEAISSIFGGYILGILAYESRNIYGGLIAHLGVAWGMEYLAYLQT